MYQLSIIVGGICEPVPPDLAICELDRIADVPVEEKPLYERAMRNKNDASLRAVSQPLAHVASPLQDGLVVRSEGTAILDSPSGLVP